MTFPSARLFSAASFSIVAMLMIAHLRSSAPLSTARNVKAEAKPRLSFPEARDWEANPAESPKTLSPVLPGTRSDHDATCAAVEELATRDPAAALSFALATSEQNMRQALLSAVLRGWARVDLAAAGAWILSQATINRREAFTALFASAARQPDEAIRFAQETARIHAAESERCTELLISALCRGGEYERAVRFATDDAATRTPDQLVALYRHWSAQAPERAWLSATALPDQTMRFAALETTVRAWCQADPRALVERARHAALGSERTMALTMGLRAWLDQDLDAAAAWLLRWEPTGTLAHVDIDLVLEE